MRLFMAQGTGNAAETDLDAVQGLASPRGFEPLLPP